MYIFVFEDGSSKLSYLFEDDIKQWFDSGYVINIFNITDHEYICQWNGSDFEELDVIKD